MDLRVSEGGRLPGLDEVEPFTLQLEEVEWVVGSETFLVGDEPCPTLTQGFQVKGRSGCREFGVGGGALLLRCGLGREQALVDPRLGETLRGDEPIQLPHLLDGEVTLNELARMMSRRVLPAFFSWR